MGFLDEVLENVGKEYGAKGFEEGTHTVVIGEANAAESNDRKIIRVTVFDPKDNDITAEATLWFHTEGGAKMGVAKVLGLLVHNQTTEEKKEAVRKLGKKLFGSISTPEKSREVALTLLQEKLIGKEGFLVVTIDNPKYTTSSYGDLWHYAREADGSKSTEDKPKKDDVVTDLDDNEIPDLD